MDRRKRETERLRKRYQKERLKGMGAVPVSDCSSTLGSSTFSSPAEDEKSCNKDLMTSYFQDQRERNLMQKKLQESKSDQHAVTHKYNSPKQRRTNRETDLRRLKRANPDVRTAENSRETALRQHKRRRPEVKQKEVEAQRKKRNDPMLKQAETVRETTGRQRKRKDPEVKLGETRSRRLTRTDPKVKLAETVRETTGRQQKRKDPEVKLGETRSRRLTRTDPKVKLAETVRETTGRQQKRKDPEVKLGETRSRRLTRTDPKVKLAETVRESTGRQQKRKDPEVKLAETVRETTGRQQKRKNTDVKEAEIARETPSKRLKRNDLHFRLRERICDTTSKRKRRETGQCETDAIQQFKRAIQFGPTYICTSCHRRLLRTNVVKFNATKFTDDVLVQQCQTQKLSPDGVEYICLTCQTYLKKGECPLLCTANGLQLDEIPEPLNSLTQLEATLIARRIPFMKLLALPRGKQNAIHGCVVNVPVEPERTISVLPSVPSPETMILVKLKRQLHYRGHSYMQNIKPQRILDSLFMLKNTLQNKLYEDVEICDNWKEHCEQSDPELWESLTLGTQQTEHLSNPGENNGENSCDDNMVNETQPDETLEDNEDERCRLSGLPLDTCLQPKDVGCNIVMSIAPGEGKKPQSLEMDEHAEELSFPHLFPTGKYGFSYQRSKKLTLKKYFQARILNCDGRFSKNIEYIFYAQYRCEAKEVRDSLSIALRKSKGENITAGEVKEKVSTFIRNDLGIHFLQKIRGSPAFFNKLLYDLLGMIRQLGPCNWFITLSSADLKWPEALKMIALQQGLNLSDEDTEKLSWEEKCQLLRSNPVTAAVHFNERVQLFLKHILRNKNINPVGEILDYRYRIEFQQRGSPHVHMVAWVKDCPSFEKDGNEKVAEFVDSFVSCRIPDNNKELTDLVTGLQRHKHSHTCKKHGQICRFHFPRFPVRKTVAFQPPSDLPPETVQIQYKEALSRIQDQLNEMEPQDQLSLDNLFIKANVSESLYMKALEWLETKNGQPAIFLQREPKECFINNYNSMLMTAWQANLDIQYITNVYACVMYVASYLSKPEKTLGDVLRGVSTSSQHMGAKQSMKCIAKKFLSHREISAQEAVYRLLSLPLTKGSREVVFIPTDLPENRTKLLKPMNIIKNLEEDDTDIFQMGILEKYAARPNSLQTICLAEFASLYKYHCKENKSDEKNLSDSEATEEHTDFPTDFPKSITLKKGLGELVLRRLPSIVRSHQWSQKSQPEQYYHAFVLLYLPWRDEHRDLCQTSYMDTWRHNNEEVSRNQSKFQNQDVNEALEQMEERNSLEDSWNMLAPQTEQNRSEDFLEGSEEINTVLNTFDTSKEHHASRDLGLPFHQYELQSEKMSTLDWYELISSLNTKQFELHQFVVEWCTKMFLSHVQPKPEPFHIFLTGGAGVGKSHLVRTIVQTIARMLSRNNQLEENHVLVAAPTGAAAYNIAGHTLHSAFLLPIHTRTTDDYISLSGEKLAALKEAIGNVKVVIMDEVSMVGSDMLLTIHRRLCDLMGNEEPFGGVSIIAVGDLLQLPPVAQRPVYSLPHDELASIYGSLWTNLFQIIELTEIQRQKDDQSFALLLNRIRTGDQTESDIETLQSRRFPKNSEHYPKEATHVFAYNKQVNEHNSSMLKDLQGVKIIIPAIDSRKDDQTGSIDTAAFDGRAGGLPKVLTVSVNCRVMLIKNTNVADGLVNSAAGVITGFDPPIQQDMDISEYRPKYILVTFDDKRVGRQCRNSHKGTVPLNGATPISMVETPVQLGKYSKITSKRRQFPLTLSWGVTIHKEQGKTESQLVLSCEGSFQAGQFYTAVSRTKDLSGLFILDEVQSSKIKVNKSSLQEIARMKKNCEFVLPTPKTMSLCMQNYFKVHVHNVNSFHAHFSNIVRDNYIDKTHVTCFQETWLKPSDLTPDFPHHTVVRNDSNTTTHRSGGLLLLIHESVTVVQEIFDSKIHLQHQLVILSKKEHPSVRVCILNIYRNPCLKMVDSLTDLELLIHHIPQGIPAVITGDFNIDLQKSNNSTKQLLKLMTYHGFHQCVNMPTHRKGGLLDHVYCNFDFNQVIIDTIPTYYSDHLLLSIAFPVREIIH